MQLSFRRNRFDCEICIFQGLEKNGLTQGKWWGNIYLMLSKENGRGKRCWKILGIYLVLVG